MPPRLCKMQPGVTKGMVTMAKKSEAKTEEEKVQMDAQKVHIPENVTLPEQEKSAVEEIQSSPTGTGKAYRLKNPDTQYTEPGTNWTITADQAKTLPENPSSETLERIKKGFLVEGSGEE